MESELDQSKHIVDLLFWYDESWIDIEEKYPNNIVRLYEENGVIVMHVVQAMVKYSIYRNDEFKYTQNDVLYLLEQQL